MKMYEIADIIDGYRGLSRKALEYGETTKALVDASKQTGFDASRWDEIAAFLDPESFERVGNFKEVMDWTSYSLSVYAFDQDGKIRHLDIYLQMPLPDPAMLASYADVDISG